MKKKVLVLVAIACICLFSFENVIAYQQEEMVIEDGVVWGTGKQYWWNGWNLCCDKSDKDAPCRQSTSSCP